MSKQICGECLRKTECYTKEGLEKLDKMKTYEELTGYECGALFRDYEGAREFIRVVGDVINAQSKITKNRIIKQIAEKCNSNTYAVLSELYED